MFEIGVIIVTVLMFIGFQKIYFKYNNPFLLPFLTVTVATCILLSLFNFTYDEYMQGGEWINKMLGPAVVALALPLYNQRALINKYKFSIFISLCAGMIIGLISVFTLLKLFGASETFLNTALPKSLTTPIAMQVSETIGGIPALSAVMVMFAGFTGAILGSVLYEKFNIQTPISRGSSMGAASHGVGITKLKEYGEEDLSIGSLSMGLTAVLGAIIVPIFAMLFM